MPPTKQRTKTLIQMRFMLLILKDKSPFFNLLPFLAPAQLPEPPWESPELLDSRKSADKMEKVFSLFS
jgi:hypothetical protein